jgi:hypothetical protein
MPATYEPIATFTTTTSSTTSYTFSSIPSTYTDLVLICDLKATSSNSSIVVRFNGDSASNYSNTQMYGNASTVISQRFTSQTEGYLSFSGFPTARFATTIVNFMNYSNTTTNKTYIGRGGYSNSFVDTSVGLWRNTAAISSMTLFAGNFFDTGCTLTLYGIKAA